MKVSLHDKFARITEHWRPKVVAELNGQEVKLVKLQGEFPWHAHANEDELFLVWRGEMRIEFEDRPAVVLAAGEMCVVPRGLRHRTLADAKAEVLIFEPAAVVNTGDASPSEFTASMGAKI